MAAFFELFGEKLLSKNGLVSTEDTLAGKHVLVYFSAHWCPPCRGFTPKLAEFHKKFSEAKGFQTVFVSSDKDENQFKEYFAEMPWLALPFDNRDAKNKLSKKFKVQGIPALMVLDKEGKLITSDGRSKVMENFETCDGFPWIPPTFNEVIGDCFLKQDGSKVDRSAIAGKTLGLYFSAHWCPPCRGFTPKLKEFYTEYKKLNPDFEIVFVSSDKDESGMTSYFNNDHGDYLVLPFDKRKEKEALSSMFGVDGIPTFVVLDKDGQVLNVNARSKVGAGAQAVHDQGWEPAPVGDLAEGPEAAGTDINETPTVVVFCPGSSPDEVKAIRGACETLAKKYIAKAKASGDSPDYIFLISTQREGGIVDRLKALVKKDAGAEMDAAGDKPFMFLFDIPDQGAFYISTDDVNEANIEAMIRSKEDGKLTRKQLGE